ncbi:MAG: hypothetical protein BalsKO_17180 [Balneolaceae bacterium]
MLTIEELSNEIISVHRMDKKTVVSICGAADLGKSYLSKQITESLIDRNLSAVHFTLDSYLMERKTRIERGLSGYNIEAYNIEEALKNLIELKNGQSIAFKPYDHKVGQKASDSISMNSSDVIIFDGLHSMHSSFLPYIDITIFVYTKDDLLKKIRKEADLNKRNYTTEFSEKISGIEFNLYKTNVEIYKERANCLLFLEAKWKYKLTRIRHTSELT